MFCAGCISVGIIDLREAQVSVVLFKEGFLSRVRVDKAALGPFIHNSCAGNLIPLSIHQHEKRSRHITKSTLNINRICDEENTGGHHDPGFACGPTGATACKRLNINPSSYVFFMHVNYIPFLIQTLFLTRCSYTLLIIHPRRTFQ